MFLPHIGLLIALFGLLLYISVSSKVSKEMETREKLLLVQIDDCRQSESTDSLIKLRVQNTLTTILHLENFLLQQINVNVEEYNIKMEFYDKSVSTFIPLMEDSQIIEITRSQGVDRILVKTVPFRSIDLSSLLRLKGRSYDTSKGFTINGSTIQITSPGQAHLGTGLTIWDGSYVLAKYLEHHSEIVNSKRVLEVGAGTGIAGIAAALLGASSVYITDLLYTLDNLRINVETNLPSHVIQSIVSVQELDWSDENTYPQKSFREWEIILGADVVWLEHLVPSLVKCLEAIVGINTKVIIAHQSRSRYTDELFFSSMERSFSIEQIDTAVWGDMLPKNIKLWCFTKKFENLSR